VHLDSQKSVSQELICVLSSNSQRMLKRDGRLTKRQYVHATTNTSTTATIISYTTTVTQTTISIATTCKAKGIKMKISRSLVSIKVIKRTYRICHSNG
jgi:hypothetical protein